jgi:hypothetical protein
VYPIRKINPIKSSIKVFCNTEEDFRNEIKKYEIPIVKLPIKVYAITLPACTLSSIPTTIETRRNQNENNCNSSCPLKYHPMKIENGVINKILIINLSIPIRSHLSIVA